MPNLHRGKLLFLVFAGAVSLMLLVVSGYQLYDFTDSDAFCGRICHEVMYPEYTAFQASPHSRVRCSECHVGPGADYLVKSKISGIPQIFYTLSGTYPRPINTPVENLRPARETCEQCHRPEEFSGDLVKYKYTYKTDEFNTERIDTRVLRVGGGKAGAAFGIHWHIAANVWYLPFDEQRQEIGWVGVEGITGGLTEYIDPKRAADVTPERIKKEKRLMDCVDCHNRATHIFYAPEQLIDTALEQGRIDKTLPFVKRESLKLLDPPSPSLEAALAKVETIRQFYSVNFPQVTVTKQAQLAALAEELKEVARLTVFPHMRVDWKTHIDNLAHQEYPGCFRCHGKLIAASGAAEGATIDAKCESCHYALTAEGALAATPIPHTLEGRQDCLLCHGENGVNPYPSDHTGRDNNSCILCHKVSTVLAAPIPHQTPGFTDCLLCHSESGIRPFPADHAGRTNITCTVCHQPP